MSVLVAAAEVILHAMGEPATSLIHFDDAIELAEEQGLNDMVCRRRKGTGYWVAIVMRFNGTMTSTAKAETFEDAVIKALMDVGVQW